MALSGLDIYKLLPKTNCKECGFVTCLAFAMQLAKKSVVADKCPYLSVEAKRILQEASSQPPIRLVAIGAGDNRLQLGNETVLFRHEEKFRNPCGIGFIIDDSLPDEKIKLIAGRFAAMSFERVGQLLKPDVLAVRQSSTPARFAAAVKLVVNCAGVLNLALMPGDAAGARAGLREAAGLKPLLYRISADNYNDFSAIAVEFGVPVAVYGDNLQAQADLINALNQLGVNDIILDTPSGILEDRLWMLSQWRRQALKRNNRVFGYPCVTVLRSNDIYVSSVEAAGYIAKYSGLILMNVGEPEEVLTLLTLRQNIYSDPQKPLQIEPKVYPVGSVSEKSPVLVTTNFSLSYFTVLSEVESSKVPAYIISVDTEGMSVLTAWAAEKFTPERICAALEKFGVSGLVRHKKLIIPGYVAMMSGNLEEESGWQIVVGPKEASGITAFLKNLA